MIEVNDPNPKKGEGQKLAGCFMQQLIELYEMVALNEQALRETERLPILKARLALAMFEKAMQSFKAEFSQTLVGTDTLRVPSGCQATNASAQV